MGLNRIFKVARLRPATQSRHQVWFRRPSSVLQKKKVWFPAPRPSTQKKKKKKKKKSRKGRCENRPFSGWEGVQIQKSPKPTPDRQHQLALEWSHDQQSACLGSEDTAHHLQAPHEARRNMGGLQNKDSNISTKKLEEDGSTVANKIWTSPGPFTKVMSQSRSILGWRTAAWWRSRASWGMADRGGNTKCKCTCRTPHFHNRSHSTDDMCAWLKFELRPQNRSFIHASCFTLRLTVH